MRTRRHIQKFYQMKTQLQAVSLRIQTLRSNQQMGEAMKGATRAMGMMNRSMNLPQVQRIMREFERESEVMDMKEEMMSDAVDEAMDDEGEGLGEEEESDAILKEVLDGIGVDLSQNVRRRAHRGDYSGSVPCVLTIHHPSPPRICSSQKHRREHSHRPMQSQHSSKKSPSERMHWVAGPAATTAARTTAVQLLRPHRIIVVRRRAAVAAAAARRRRMRMRCRLDLIS